MSFASPLAWGEEAGQAPDIAPALSADKAVPPPEPNRERPAASAGASHHPDGQADKKTLKERPLTPAEVLSLARFFMNRGELDKAEKIYHTLYQSSPIDDIRIEAAFQLGQILVHRGRYREAASYFISILNRRPDSPRVRLELARAYYLEKNYPDATHQFMLVKGGKLPPEVIANVDIFLDRIRRQKNWTFNFGVSPMSDSNINQASGSREECVNAMGMTLCRPLEEKSSGIGVNLRAYLDYYKRFSQDWGLRATAGFYGLEYRGRSFDDYTLYAALGPRYLWSSGEASLQPTFRKRWYAGEPYREEYGLRADGRKIMGRLILDAGASYDTINYDKAFIHQLLHGATWGAYLQPRYILNDRTFIQVGLNFLRENTRDARFTNDNWSYSLGAYRVLPYGFSLFVEGSLTRSNYKAPQWHTTQDNRYVATTRRDKLLGLSVSLSSNRLEKYNLTPVLRYSHIRRDSNIWNREYSRNRLDLLMNLRI